MLIIIIIIPQPVDSASTIKAPVIPLTEREANSDGIDLSKYEICANINGAGNETIIYMTCFHLRIYFTFKNYNASIVDFVSSAKASGGAMSGRETTTDGPKWLAGRK